MCVIRSVLDMRRTRCIRQASDEVMRYASDEVHQIRLNKTLIYLCGSNVQQAKWTNKDMCDRCGSDEV